MAYRDFTLLRVQADFGLTVTTPSGLVAAAPPVPTPADVASSMARHLPLAMAQRTEKARSELLVSPLLAEVWAVSGRRVAVHSGAPFDVDPAAGLTGTCDFMLALSGQLLLLDAPVVTIVEAKRDSIPDGLGQCAAAMVAAQRFNREAGRPREVIYGAVTTGVAWRFVRLAGADLAIDLDEYPVADPDKILGILLYCCGISV